MGFSPRWRQGGKLERKCTAVALLVAASLCIGTTVGPGVARAFRVTDLTSLGGLGIPRWDAASRTVAGKERSLDGGLRFSLQGGSYQAYRDLFSWSGTPPSAAAFQAAVEAAFDAWLVVDPATLLPGTFYFVADLGTPVVAANPAVVVGLNDGAEIDLLADDESPLFGPASPSMQGFAFHRIDNTTANDLTLTSGTTSYPGVAISGADIVLNNHPTALWTLDWFQLILTHEIGHALGLTDVDVFPGFSGFNSGYFDDDYDDTSSATAFATLTNSFAQVVDPADPDDSPGLTEFAGDLDGDPGLDSFGVDILMETEIPPGLLAVLAAPLQNDDFAGRQFLYPVPEPGVELLLVSGVAGLFALDRLRGRSRVGRR